MFMISSACIGFVLGILIVIAFLIINKLDKRKDDYIR